MAWKYQARIDLRTHLRAEIGEETHCRDISPLVRHIEFHAVGLAPKVRHPPHRLPWLALLHHDELLVIRHGDLWKEPIIRGLGELEVRFSTHLGHKWIQVLIYGRISALRSPPKLSANFSLGFFEEGLST